MNDELELRLTLENWLYHEAQLLDDNRFDEWLALLTDDVDYRAPVRVTVRRGQPDVDDGMCFFEENIFSLRLRVRRLGTDVAWAEDPPSRTRRVVGNVRVQASVAESHVNVRSNLLLFRNRSDDATHDLLAAERRDQLRFTPQGWRLSRRVILLDQVVAGTKNFGVFL